MVGSFSISFDPQQIRNLTEGSTLEEQLKIQGKASEIDVEMKINPIALKMHIKAVPSIENSQLEVLVGKTMCKYSEKQNLEITSGQLVDIRIRVCRYV